VSRRQGKADQVTSIITEAIESAADNMHAWLRGLPEWPVHPTNPSGSVSSHFGPTLLSEHDCVLHFARWLHQAGVPWEDIHLELSPGQWMFKPATDHRLPKRIDLAIIRRERLRRAQLPTAAGDFRLDAVVEFGLASNYWQFGAGSPRALLNKVQNDVAKVAEYVRSGLADHGYVVVVEECDHGFAPSFEADARTRLGVDVLILRRWR
jgi:hypothetical protein